MLQMWAMRMSLRNWCLQILLAAAWCLPLTASGEEDQPGSLPAMTILIENVRLIEADATADPVVNLLMVDGVLDIVTKEAVPIKDLTIRIDAQRGFLLGKLQVGAQPTFLILDGDPREDFEVLTDTKAHMVLAVNNGEIVRNRLATTAEMPKEDEPQQEQATWLAYTPPPISLPTQYLDATKWNRWESKYVDGLFLGALVLDRMSWTAQDDASEQQVGDVKDFNGGEIRGLRFGAIGTLNFDDPWVYTVFAATSAFDKGYDESRDDSFQWFDLRLDIPTYKNTSLSIGKQKEPISMERVTSLLFLPMQERSAAIDAMLPARNTGVMLSGNSLNKRMSWAGGVFNNWLDSDESISNTATQFVGRLTGVPFVSADSSSLLHLGVGLRYSNAKQGVRYFTEPEFSQSPVYVDTGLMADAKNAYTLDFEVSWRQGPVWLSSEFLRTKVDSAAAGDPSFSGYQISGVWALTGEMRTYNSKAGVFNRPPVAKSVYQGGLGAWELMVRYSNTDLTDANITGGEMDVLSVGVRWWLTYFMTFDLNYRAISLDRFGVSGDSRGFNTRLVLSLE
jgi:phosphate-selective porin OprO/OprP